MTAAPSPPSGAIFLWRRAFFIFFVTLAVYHPITNNKFAFDDTPAIVNNRDVVNTDSPLLSVPFFSHDFWGQNITDSTSHKSYRPLTVITFAAARRLASTLTVSHEKIQHWINLFLHAANSVLVYTWVNRFHPGLSLTVGVLFSVHPLHVDSVAPGVGRADLLYSLCVLLALNTGQSLLGSLICILMTCAATLFKEQGVMLLPLVVAQDILIHHNLRIRREKPFKRRFHVKVQEWKFLKARILTFATVTALVVVARLWIMDFRGPTFQEGDNPAAFIGDRLLRHLNFNYVYAINSYLLVLPQWLCFDWSMGCIPLIQGLDDLRLVAVSVFWLFAFSLVKKSLTLLCEEKRIKRSALPLLAMALTVLPFLPSSNVFFVVGFVVAERNLYLSVLGFNLLVMTGYSGLVRYKGTQHGEAGVRFSMRAMIKIGLVILTASHAAKSYIRCKEWRDEYTLYKSGLKVCPQNAKVYYNIGKLDADVGRVSRAEWMYRKSIDLWPNYEHALNNLANLIRKNRGKLGEAKSLLKRAIEANPKFAAAHMNLGIVEAALGDASGAEASYVEAIALRRGVYPDAHYNLGTLYLSRGLKNQALQQFETATDQKPKHFSAWSNMVTLLDDLGDFSRAEVAAQKALSIFPEKPDFYFHLGNIFGKTGKFEKSEVNYKTALSIGPVISLYHSNMGVLYHRWKRYPEAVEHYNKALKLDPDNASARSNLESIKKSFREQH